MPDQQQGVSRTEDAVDAAAVKKLARDTEKENLLTELAILQCRVDAFEKIIDDRRGRLEGLMAQDGEKTRVVSTAQASFGNRRAVEVVSAAECARIFSKAILAENFAPTIAFVEACEAEGIKIAGALRVGSSPSFKVERARTKAAKELQKRIIEETRKTAEETVTKIRKSLREQVGE
jgi:hypothetical protein